MLNRRLAVGGMLSVCVCVGVAGGQEPLTTELVASGFTLPVQATHAPGDYTRLFIVEQRIGTTGRIRTVNLKTGEVQSTSAPFLNVPGVSANNEQGLLGLAFHPNYQENGLFYVNFTSSAGATVVRQYQVSDDPDIADAGSGTNIITVSQPFSNHNAGWINFGPDGYLYISMGDGGSGGDPQNNAQNLNTLLGSMLRIDVDGGTPYAIPPDNPFVGLPNHREEIWAWGLRNPWRSSFDRETGDLYIADVGQNQWEEINFQPGDSTGGENYGWRCYEGNANFNLTGCAPAGTMVFPIHVYGIAGFANPNCAIVGGYVYRGCQIPSLTGHYLFADYCAANFWSFTYDGRNLENFTNRTSELGSGISLPSSFGEDARGEVYIVRRSSPGQIYRVVPQTPTISHADLDCDGVVGVDDLLELLANWGECDGCLADLTGDGMVGVDDLLELLSEWG